MRNLHNKHDRNQYSYQETSLRYLIETWILALFLIAIILGAETIADVGASLLETFFTHIGVL